MAAHQSSDPEMPDAETRGHDRRVALSVAALIAGTVLIGGLAPAPLRIARRCPRLRTRPARNGATAAGSASAWTGPSPARCRVSPACRRRRTVCAASVAEAHGPARTGRGPPRLPLRSEPERAPPPGARPLGPPQRRSRARLGRPPAPADRGHRPRALAPRTDRGHPRRPRLARPACREPVRRQSAHLDTYRAMVATLATRGLAYPCFCSRGTIAAVAETATARGLPVPRDPDGAPLYPGTCRDLPADAARARRAAGEPHSWRLDMGRALIRAPGPHGVRSFVVEGDGAGRRIGSVTIEPAEPARWVTPSSPAATCPRAITSRW